MTDKIRDYLFDSKKSIRERTFNLLMLYISIAALFACIFFVSRGLNTPLIFLLAVMPLLMMALYFLQLKFSKLDILSAIAVYIINIVFLPLLFLFGGGLKSGMPLIFIGGYIIMYILLENILLVFSAVLISGWYSIVITYTYYYPEYVQHNFYGYELLIDLIICMIVAATVSVLIWVVYEGVYNSIHSELMNASAKIDQARDVKSRFLTNMSHELRTPMNAILGMSELLENSDNENRDIVYETSLIRESAYSLLTTINNVLTYAKLDAGNEQLNLNQFKFSQLVSDIIYSVNMEINNKDRVEIFANVEPTIPDVLYGDDAKIRNILSYILFAAVRNTDEGRISLEIKHDYNKSNNSVTLHVRITDTGIGMSDDEHKSVFSSYEIYDTRKDSQLRRIGLELTICRYLIEMMGGKININTIDGVGSAISFSLKLFAIEKTPIVDTKKINVHRVLVYVTKGSRVNIWGRLFDQFSIVPDIAGSYVAFEADLRDTQYDAIIIPDYSYDQVKDVIASYELEKNTYIITDNLHSFGDFGKCRILRRPIYSLTLNEVLSGSWNESAYTGTEARESFTAPNANVLIVDDNIVNLKVAQSILSQYEINTYISTSGRDAIEKIKNSHFDLVLLDQMMPEMDGVETLTHIRGLSNVESRRTPIVCLTANIGEDVKEELLKAGFQDYLAKPIKIRYLEEILKTYLSEDMIVHKKVAESTDKIAQSLPEKSESKAVTKAVTNAGSDASFPPGLTVERGLLQMGGDESTYNLILNTYYKDCGEKLTTIPKMFEDGDIKLYSITVHAVKGSSASIGALEVSELFRQLEMASKGGDLEFCRENMPHAMSKLQEILGIVKEYLTEKNAFVDMSAPLNTGEEETKIEDKDNSKEESEKVENNEFDLSLLTKLVTEIDRINFDESDRIIEKLIESDFGGDINEKITLIKKAYDDFDYVSVKDIVKEMQDES